MPYYNITGAAWYKTEHSPNPNFIVLNGDKIKANTKAQAISIVLVDNLNKYVDYGWCIDEDQPNGPYIEQLPLDQQLRLDNAPMLPGFE